MIEQQFQLSSIVNGRLPNLPISQEIEFMRKTISNGLDELGFKDFRIVLTGSLVCGHYTNPKPATHSLNPNCPFESVIECDIRVILPENTNIMSKSFRDDIESVTGLKSEYTVQKIISRFGDQIPMMVGYTYKELTETLGLEFEVCFNVDPYYEIAQVWNQVFTPSEIDYQTEIRTIARDVLKLDYLTQFQELKAIQTADCRYRVCASYCFQNNFPELVADERYEFVPLSIPIPDFLVPKVDSWFLKMSRPTLDLSINSTIREKFESISMDSLIVSPPKIPLWLEKVESIKNI